MPQILRPADWQITSRKPLFAVDRGDTPGRLRLSVALSSEYFGGPLAAPVRGAVEIPHDSGAVVAVQLSQELADGQYVAYLTNSDNGTVVLADRGFFVKDAFREVRFPLRDAHAEAAFRAAVMPPGVGPIAIDVVRGQARRLNIVLPSLEKSRFSGGPNTALALGQVLADRGIPVNFISCDTPVEPDHRLLHDHLTLLTGIREPRAPVTFADGHRADSPVAIGDSDIMLGTAWWTVQKFRHCLQGLRTPRFVYLIQEFEPALYPYSTSYALAEETYALDHLAIYNHRFLYDYFRMNRIGSFAAGHEDGVWFDPVIDTRHFYYDEGARRAEAHTLLFYARPTMAVRNLYEIGCAALARLAGEGLFDESWKLHSMGEKVGDIYLPRDQVVEELPWMGFGEYAARMRSCDILLSLMLSPHPSYPPLEGAASGAVVVTNRFANKTPAQFARFSSNIIASAPTIDGVTEGLRTAIGRIGDRSARSGASRVSMPSDWRQALAGAADRVAEFWSAAR